MAGHTTNATGLGGAGDVATDETGSQIAASKVAAPPSTTATARARAPFET